MRIVIFSLVGLLGATAMAPAQQLGQPLRGVNGPIESGPASPGGGKSGGAKAGKLQPLQAPDYGRLDGGPVSNVPGTVRVGTTLPGDVHPSPIAGRPGYGAATVNGQRVIVDMNSNQVFQTSD